MKARIAFAGPQSDIAELQYIGSSSAATREEMDSIGEATKSAQVECDAARAEQEKLGRVMIGVRAGLGHLQDMLRVRLCSCLYGDNSSRHCLRCGSCSCQGARILYGACNLCCCCCSSSCSSGNPQRAHHHQQRTPWQRARGLPPPRRRPDQLRCRHVFAGPSCPAGRSHS